jgi:tetratricopeptide (TPR) repeat protein/predicted Ser/Thr protein kinase
MRDALIREWFDRLADGPADQREALLSEVPAEIRHEVVELLSHLNDSADQLLQSPIIRDSPHSLPEKIDRYRIHRLLGTGGMGVVYEAEQDYPQRLVALKLIRPGIVAPTAVKRFHLEATILGKLRHPGIAQVYDAGVASTGQPYFAMELVRGQPIEDIAGQLTRHELLELFAHVCDAVDHAHNQGVIHRDLKPSNIMIDEHRQPKILDFGVARSENLDVSQHYTSTGELVGTLAYMSPEQFAGPNAKIDRRVDVHALGLILYRLLAGRPPYDLEGQPLTEIARIVRNVDPIPLGRRDPRLRGDLETIVGKALEKAPERRYDSAGALARDIRLHLSDEPIQARPPSAVYRVQKYVRRHRMSVALIAALAVGLVATSFAGWRAMKAERAASLALKEVEAQQATTLTALEESTKARARTRTALYAMTDEVVEQALGRRERLGPYEREFFQQILNFIEESAKDEGDTPSARHMRALSLRRVGSLQTALGDRAAATQGFQKAAEILEKLVVESPDDSAYPTELIRTWNQWADNLAAAGQLTEAERLHRRALDLQEKLTSAQPDNLARLHDLVNVLLRTGTTLTNQGRHEEAETLIRKATSIAET